MLYEMIFLSILMREGKLLGEVLLLNVVIFNGMLIIEIVIFWYWLRFIFIIILLE